MEDRINQALLQLEKDLQSINTAREQVESTVKASAELQKVVGEYVSSVKTLCVSLQSWESDLKAREGSLSHEYEEAIGRVNTSCNEIINSFGAEVEKTSTDFKTKTEPVIDRFSEQIGKLEKYVQELNALRDEIKKTTREIDSVKETLTQISKDLKESQEQQDEVLNEIKLKGEDIKNQVDAVNSSVGDISEKLDKIGINLNEGISSLDKKADVLSSDLISIKNSCHSILSVSSDIKSLIQKSSEHLAKSIDDYHAVLAKSANINRWIIIVAFIILTILHILIR